MLGRSVSHVMGKAIFRVGAIMRVHHRIAFDLSTIEAAAIELRLSPLIKRSCGRSRSGCAVRRPADVRHAAAAPHGAPHASSAAQNVFSRSTSGTVAMPGRSPRRGL
jgi:hypothetical protein